MVWWCGGGSRGDGSDSSQKQDTTYLFSELDPIDIIYFTAIGLTNGLIKVTAMLSPVACDKGTEVQVQVQVQIYIYIYIYI